MRVGDFALFDLWIDRRGRGWRWSVSSPSGDLLLVGRERSRSAARYMASRAMFQLLLTAPYRNGMRSKDRSARWPRPECQQGISAVHRMGRDGHPGH